MSDISIGEFSARSRLSVRMLRHYHDHGVLIPTEVDQHSGYRRYSLTQLDDALLVRRLRDVGLPVSAIATVLAARGTPAFRHALELRRDELAAELNAAHDRLALIDRMLTEGVTMNDITVTRTTVPAMRVIALRDTVPTYADEGQLWARLIPAMQAQGLSPNGPGGCIEHDNEYREADVDLTIWSPVAAHATAEAPLQILDLPERDVVMARVVGPYSLISEAHAQIESYLAQHSLNPARLDDESLCAKVFNRYLNDPGCTAPSDLVTEVCVPVA